MKNSPHSQPIEDKVAAAEAGKGDAAASAADGLTLQPPFATYTDKHGTRIVGGRLTATAHPNTTELSSQHEPPSKGGKL